MSTSAGKLIGQLRKTFSTISSGYKQFKEMNEAVGDSKTSFSDYIRWTSKSEDATEAFGLATAYAKLRVVALNMALSAGIGLVVSYFSKKIIEAAQRVDKLAESSKEAADAATSTTSSLSELVDEYEKLGKKSDWDTDDMEQAQKIQDEILQLAKEQGTLDEDRAKKIDLQNGKYEEQLGLLREISGEQIRASSEDYEDNADKQGRKLVKDAKKTINTGYVLTSSTDHKMAEDLQTQGFDIFKGVAANALVLGPKNKNDPESVVEYYNQISEALKYLKENYDKADLESKGIYEGLYNILADQKDALEDQVKAYNDSTNAISENELALRNWETYLALTNTNARAVKGAVGTLADSIEGFNADKLIDLLNGNGLGGLNSTQTTALDKIKEFMTLKGYSTDQIESFVNVLTQVGVVAPKTVNALAQTTQQMETISQNIDNIQSAYKACTTAMEEYNKYGYMSTDALQGLLSMNDEYLSCLDVVDGKLKINNERYADLIVAQYTEAEATAIEQAMHELEALQADDTKEKTEDLTTATKDQQTALENAVPAIQDATTATGRLAIALATANGEANGDADMEAKIKTITDALNTRLTAIHTNMQAAIKGGKALKNQLNGFKKSSSSSSKSATDVASAFDTLTKAMKEYNKNGYISADTMKSLMTLEDKFTSCLVKNGDKLEINANAFRKLVEKQLEEEEASSKASKSTAELKRILGYLDKNVKSETISFEELTDVIKGYGDALDDAQEKTSGLKSAFGTIHDILNTDNPAGALTSDNVESVIDLIQEHKELKDILYDENGSLIINEDSLKKATIALLKNEKAATKDAAIQAILQKSIDDLSTGVISITDYLKGLNTELDDVDAKLDKFQSGFNDIIDIVDEYNAYGQLSQDSYQKLLRLDPKYLECLQKEGNQLKFNAAQYRMLYAEQVHQLAMTAKTTTQRDTYTSILADIFGFTPEQVDQYKEAIKGYNDVVQEFTEAGVAQYGNVSNLNRDKLEWTQENLEKYHEFVDEMNSEDPGSIVEGDYSTVLGTSKNIDGLEIAYTPMLQTDEGLIPLTKDQLWEYLDKVINRAYESEGGYNAENLLKIDAEGFEQEVNGSIARVHGMIAAVQGQILNGVELTGADVAAIAGATEEELQKSFGQTSAYVNKDMHTLQEKASEAKNKTKEFGDILNDVGIDGALALQRLENHFGDANSAAEKFQAVLSNIKDLFSSLLDFVNSANDNNSNDLKIYGDAMTDEIDKRIEALQNANDEQEKAIELAKLQAELEKAETQKTVRVYTSNGYEWQADESAIKEARDNLNSKQRENALNDEIDKLNKLKDKYTELINLIGSSYEDYQKKQEYAAKIQGMTFDQMTTGLDGYKDNVIANMKAIQGATNVNNVVTNLTNLVNTLVKLNDVLNGLSTGTTQSGGITGLFNRLQRAIGTFSDKSSGKGFWGRLLDAGKSFLGVGGSNKYTVAKGFLGESISEIPKLGQAIAKSLGNVKTTVVSAAQGIFSGSGGLSSVFSQGFKGLSQLASGALNGLGGIFQGFSTTLLGSGGSGLFASITKIFTGIGAKVAGVIGTAGGTGVAGTIAAAVSHIPVIGKILLGGTLAVSAIGGGSFGTGIKRIGSGIVNVVKGIGSAITKAVKGVGTFISKLMPWNWGKSSSDSGSKKKGIGSWKIWPWNWGRAKGDKHIDQAAPYNVDEEGEEIIVRNPAKGRMTYLEKGDGVIPAKTTENLMEIGKDPNGWLVKLLKNTSGFQKLSDFMFNNMSLDKLKNANTKGDILSITKDIANSQMKRLRSKFEAAWKKLAGDAGLSEEQIDSISDAIFDRMGSMITNTMDAAMGNKDLTNDQIKELCANMFQRMGYIYKNGWNNLYSLSPDMPKDVSEKLHTLFDKISSNYNSDTDSVNKVLADKIGTVTNTMNTTQASGLSGGGSYYGNSMDANIGPSASFNFSKVKKTIQRLFEKFSNSKLGAWLNKHSLGSTVDKLTKYNESNDPNMVQKALHLLTHPTELIASAVESAVKTGKKVAWAVTHPKEAAQEIASVAKDAYSKGKEVASNVKDAVTHPKKTAEKIVDKVKETYSNIKEAVSEKTNSAKNWIKDKVDKITGKKATGSRSINKSGTYNVDEKGQELIVRQPEAGRYTYLETGDGVVPADITSKLFDLGGNPDAWFQKQLARNGGLTANVQNRSQAPSISIGDIYVQKPIGDVDGLAREIVQGLPNAIYQECSKR